MDPQPPVVTRDLTVHDFICECVLRRDQRALLVADEGALRGIVRIGDAKKVPQASWSTTPVGAIMRPMPLQVVASDAELNRALELLLGETLNELPVVRGDRVVGILGRADILRFLQLREELGLRRLPPRRIPQPRAQSAA